MVLALACVAWQQGWALIGPKEVSGVERGWLKTARISLESGTDWHSRNNNIKTRLCLGWSYRPLPLRAILGQCHSDICFSCFGTGSVLLINVLSVHTAQSNRTLATAVDITRTLLDIYQTQRGMLRRAVSVTQLTLMKPLIKRSVLFLQLIFNIIKY